MKKELGLIEYLQDSEWNRLLTESLLEKLCQKQADRKINLPLATLGGAYFWESISVGEWKIQRHKVDRHCRIIDSSNVRRAYGNEKEIKALFENYRSEEIQSWRAHSKYGIVFSGGGGKGAFQIGVWKYLNERGFDRLIDGVSGASVGALNSLLFVNGDYDTAERLWSEITQIDMMAPNVEAIVSVIMYCMGESLVPTMLANGVRTLFDDGHSEKSNGVASQWRLEKLIDDNIDWSIVENSSKAAFCALTANSYFHKIEHSSNNFMIDIMRCFGRGEYVCWSQQERSKIKGLILASAALPVIYGSKKVDGHEYLDGGLQDNIPIRPLIEHGFQEIIVVHLSKRDNEKEREDWRRATARLDFSNRIIHHVYPEEDFDDGIVPTLTVGLERCRERMEKGYRAAQEQLAKLSWNTKNVQKYRNKV